MLKSTFQHLKGLSKKSERGLWERGLTTWEQYNASVPKQCSLFGPSCAESPLAESIAAYASGDMAYFAETLPTSEYYRVALEFPDEVIFLDIETTGLSLHYDAITIIGWSLGKTYGVYINGQDDALLRHDMARAKAIVTFNGTLFDLKFIQKHFNRPAIPPVHIDLRFFAKRVGLSGGQKAIEKEIGFKRKSKIAEMMGESAPILWHKYRRGDINAMRKLIEYNHADIAGMKKILDVCTSRYFQKESIPKIVQKKPEFMRQSSRILWGNGSPENSEPRAIYIPTFCGSSKPLITYAELTALHPLDMFCSIGIDLVSSEDRESGFCVLRGNKAETCRVKSDEQMIRLAAEAGADLVSIDSPLSIPRGRASFFDDDPTREEFGITRECERLLKRRGISSYPCLIPSMQKLTQRGMRLAQKFREVGIPVIESYPGAAQDIMSIPRKQAGLGYLTEGLKEFGLDGDFVRAPVSHDELDAITSAVVGHFFWAGMYEALGNPDEDYLIVPDLNADYNIRLSRKIIGLSGPDPEGKAALIKLLLERGYTHLDNCMTQQDPEAVLKESGSHADFKISGDLIQEARRRRLVFRRAIDRVAARRFVVIDGLQFEEDNAILREGYGPSFIHIYVKPARCVIGSHSLETFAQNPASSCDDGRVGIENLADWCIAHNGTVGHLIEQFDSFLVGRGHQCL